MKEVNYDELFESFNQRLGQIWGEILHSSPLIQLIKSGDYDRRLYGLYMIETFHYTAHNAKNQAMVVERLGSTAKEIQYMKFVLKHASEEAGHELMALHDLNKLGFDTKFTPETLPLPLPETDGFVSYINRVSKEGNPLRRLGYSYWAESSYSYFGEVLGIIKEKLHLENSMMTFFIEHSDIDADHFEDIKKAIKSFAKSEQDLADIQEVMEKSLYLTGRILDGIYREYTKINAREKSHVLFSS